MVLILGYGELGSISDFMMTRWQIISM